MTLWSDPNHIAIRRQPVFIVTGQVVVHMARRALRKVELTQQYWPRGR